VLNYSILASKTTTTAVLHEVWLARLLYLRGYGAVRGWAATALIGVKAQASPSMMKIIKAGGSIQQTSHRRPGPLSFDWLDQSGQ
jgi:hypothetical protein